MKGQYKISFIVFGAIAVAGIVLQAVAGNFDKTLVAFPVNLIIAALVVLSAGGLALFREGRVFKLLSGMPFSVTAIGALSVCCLVMGLIPQHEEGGLLDDVTSSWPFVLVYLALLLSLACVIARTLANFNIRRWGFYLNHIGLWLVFAGAGLGGGDRLEMTVKIPEGATATHAIAEGMMPYGLPFGVRLDDFLMEEYSSGKPKRYTSEVTAIFRDGREQRVEIDVNRPFRHGSWAFYQQSYDRAAGSSSTYSVLKAVRDPWLPVVYAGIVMLALGAVSLFPAAAGFIARRRNKYLWMLTLVAVMATVFSVFYISRQGTERVPALQSGWFVPHVVAYMISYMMLAAATVGACVQLCRNKPDEKLQSFTDGMVYSGFGLLTVGMLIGMVWAKAAWGHYWEWDPKETWALITMLAYLVYIHLRMRGGTASRAALWILPVAFVLLMITWLGVSYLPAAQSSIHVY